MQSHIVNALGHDVANSTALHFLRVFHLVEDFNHELFIEKISNWSIVEIILTIIIDKNIQNLLKFIQIMKFENLLNHQHLFYFL